MHLFDSQNPGIGGLVELTTAELTTVQNISGLGDPNADRILFWDDSAGSYQFLTPGTNLTITGTTLNATAGTGISIGDTITSGTAKSILFINPTATLAQDNTNFNYDTTAKLLQVGSGSTTSAGVQVGYANTSGGAGLWPTGVTPSSANARVYFTGNNTVIAGINASVYLRPNNAQSTTGGVVINTTGTSMSPEVDGGVNLGLTTNRFFQAALGRTIAIASNVPAFDVFQAWNNAAVTFTLARLTITDTASASASLFLDMQLPASTSMFSVRKDGAITTASMTNGLVKTTSGLLSNATAETDYVTPSGVGTLQNKTLDNTNTVTLKDTLFTLQDDGDTTKQAQFQLSGIATATTRTYTLPNGSGTIPILNIVNAWTATNTFPHGSLRLTGTSTGVLTLETALTTASNFTATFPALTGVISMSAAALTSGSVPFVTTGGALTEDNTNFTYDSTNILLKVGSGTTTSQGLQLGYSGTTGNAGIWRTGITAAGSNAALLIQSASTIIAASTTAGGINLRPNGSTSSTAAVQLVATGSAFTPEADGGVNLGTASLRWFQIAVGRASAITGSSEALSVVQTWNSSGVVFTLGKSIATITAAAAGSNLHDFQTGVGTSIVAIGARSSVTDPAIRLGGDTGTGWYRSASDQWAWTASGTAQLQLSAAVTKVGSNNVFSWSNTSNNATATADTGLSRNGAGIIEINTGTAGTFADLKLRNLIPAATVSSTSTDGFINIAGSTGAPTGVPSVTTGFASYFNSSTNTLYLYNSGWQAIGGGGGSGITIGTTTITSGTNTRVLYNNSGVVGEYAVTGSGSVMLNTSPRVVTSILDTNGNGLLSLTATTSATNYFNITNAASGAPTFKTNSGSYSMYLSGGNGYFEITGDGTSSASERLTLSIAGGSDPTFTTNLSNSSLVFTPNGTGQVKFGKNASPLSNDGAALGTTALQWSDLFLASGAVLNIANGNWVATHTSAILTVGTGDLRVSTAGTNTASVVTNGGTQTLTNKRITKRVVTVTQSATPTVNTDNTDVASITGLAQAITSMTTNLSGTANAGDMLMVQITDNGTARAITWGSSFVSTTVTLPTTTVISTMLRVLFQWNTVTSKWDCIGTA